MLGCLAVARPHAPRKLRKKRIARTGAGLYGYGYTDILTSMEKWENGKMGEVGFNVPQLRMGQAPWARRPVETEGPRTIGDKVKVRAWLVRYLVRRSARSESIIRSFGPCVKARSYILYVRSLRTKEVQSTNLLVSCM
jgi:hypothetical protein